MDRKIIQYCKGQRIRIDDEGYDATFIAPKGITFSTESRYRHIEDYDDMDPNEIIDLLRLV